MTSKSKSLTLLPVIVSALYQWNCFLLLIKTESNILSYDLLEKWSKLYIFNCHNDKALNFAK